MKNTKPILLLLILLTSTLFTACNSEQMDNTVSLLSEVAIKNFKAKFPKAQVTAMYSNASNITTVEFQEEYEGYGVAKYQHDERILSARSISDLMYLPRKVRETFKSLNHTDFLQISITEIDYAVITGKYYLIHMLSEWPNGSGRISDVYIHESGLLLFPHDDVYNTIYFEPIPQNHLDYIKVNYTGSKVVGYMSPRYLYAIWHDGVLKTIQFWSSESDTMYFWDFTKWFITPESVPTKVMEYLDQEYPNHLYNKVQYEENSSNLSIYKFIYKDDSTYYGVNLPFNKNDLK